MRWFFRSFGILSRIERKDPKYFHVVLIFIGLGQDLTHLAQKENRQSEIFLLGRQEIRCNLIWLISAIVPWRRSGDIRKTRCTTGIDDTGSKFCHWYRWCQRHRWCTLSCEYLHEFYGRNGILRGLGETDSWKKPEVENLVALSL